MEAIETEQQMEARIHRLSMERDIYEFPLLDKVNPLEFPSYLQSSIKDVKYLSEKEMNSRIDHLYGVVKQAIKETAEETKEVRKMQKEKGNEYYYRIASRLNIPLLRNLLKKFGVIIGS